MRKQQSPDLNPRDASRYRSGVMRASFLAQERADIAEAVKRMAQGMAKPKLAHCVLLKRLARYVIKDPNVCFGLSSTEDARLFEDSG